MTSLSGGVGRPPWPWTECRGTSKVSGHPWSGGDRPSGPSNVPGSPAPTPAAQ
ncbi:hypothetical protein SNL152K_3919 [Streptomyces sp. NL15-2K]|nr:hypothetical protein SNL152K_3919 [Streptomyces sp. NL15-2K]